MTASSYVVVGAGLAGSATAWQLAQRGHEVTVLERATPAHGGGSSHGSARIFRYAYPDVFYTRLVQQARDGWDELERLGGEPLITPTGAVDFGSQREAALLARVLDEAGVDNELLSAEETTHRWPQIVVDSAAVWHPAAGVIDVESAVMTMLRLGGADGAQVLTDWTATTVSRTSKGFRVEGSDGRSVEAEHVVVAAGGWLPQLLGNLSLPSSFLDGFPSLQVRQEQAFHFPYRAGFDVEPWPSLIYKGDDIQTYALIGGRDAGFAGQKVAEYNGGKVIGSAAEQDGVIDERGLERLVAHVERAMPGLLPEPYAATTCIFTNTPNEDFVIDGVDGVTVVSPCSGHGAKFAPLLGQLAADVATGSSPALLRFAVPRG
ncbi:N-methyl-L-tryptophan oxidase [Acidothermaceae bacterium B102]|nr:N-methyl-L-tryptophan oxidase [Acidothermaceae bacterium B102]